MKYKITICHDDYGDLATTTVEVDDASAIDAEVLHFYSRFREGLCMKWEELGPLLRVVK